MKIIPTEVKIKFRNLEKISLKYSASKAHRQFNITCINNKLLPIYTNIYIYNVYIYKLYWTTLIEDEKLIFNIIVNGSKDVPCFQTFHRNMIQKFNLLVNSISIVLPLFLRF